MWVLCCSVFLCVSIFTRNGANEVTRANTRHQSEVLVLLCINDNLHSLLQNSPREIDNYSNTTMNALDKFANDAVKEFKDIFHSGFSINFKGINTCKTLVDM